MLKVEDVTISFKTDLDISYKDELERLFFFNKRQFVYEERINQSIEDFSMPILKERKNKVSIVFRDEWMGQSLHILDGNKVDSELIGVIMFIRETKEMVTIVHFVLHETCRIIMKDTGINIALIIMEELIDLFKKLKGVEKVRIYYTDKVIYI